MRYVDTAELMQHVGSFELYEFQTEIKKQIEKAQNLLMDKYFAGVVDIFLEGDKKGKLPNPAFPKRMKRFYNAVATIMTYHIQQLCLKSLYDYVEYITDVKVKVN